MKSRGGCLGDRGYNRIDRSVYLSDPVGMEIGIGVGLSVRSFVRSFVRLFGRLSETISFQREEERGNRWNFHLCPLHAQTRVPSVFKLYVLACVFTFFLARDILRNNKLC